MHVEFNFQVLTRQACGKGLFAYVWIRGAIVDITTRCGASVDERAITLANRFQFVPKGVLLFVPYDIR